MSFSEDFINALKKTEHVKPEDIQALLEEYKTWRTTCPGAPEPKDLIPDHSPTVMGRESFNLASNDNWDNFHRRIKNQVEVEKDAQNPFIPFWHSKSPDKPTPWVKDTGEKLSSDCQGKLSLHFRGVTPLLNDKVENLLDLLPVESDDIQTYDSIVETMTHFLPIYVSPMGDYSDIDWRWSKTLCILAGLGMRGVRIFAKRMAETSEEDEWNHWATCDDAELKQEIIKSRSTSYYPFGLLRTDYPKIVRILENHSAEKVPTWLQVLLLTHIIKHTRFYPNYNGHPAIFAAYRTTSSMIQLHDSCIAQHLNSPANQSVLQTLCSILDVHLGTTKSRTPLQIVAKACFKHILPCQLARPVDLSYHPDLIPPPGVTFSLAFEKRSEYRWINPGILVNNVGSIDTNTGIVTPRSYISGSKALTLNWPRREVPEDEMATWFANLPKEVKPELPSTILRRHIRNINDLGYPEGFNALVDSLILTNLVRRQLAGSEIGKLIRIEFPIVVILPVRGEKDAATNQGKTNVARILCGALVPGIPVMQVVRGSSPPSQRSMATTLEQYGTAIYDEFVLPSGFDHFLNQQGLQLLATGGVATPGKALENSPGVQLKYPLFLVCKFDSFPPDIKNRMLPIFLEELNSDTRSNQNELGLIMTGLIGMQVRLSALAWIKEHDFIAKVRAGTARSGEFFRYNGHVSVAEAMTGRMYPIQDYLMAAKAQCDKQYLEADMTGLIADVGGTGSFDTKYFFETCQDETLGTLFATAKVRPLRVLDTLRAIIEDGGRRSFDSVLRQHNIREHSAVVRFTQQLEKRGAYAKHGWVLEYMGAKKSKLKDKHGSTVSHIHITQDAEEAASNNTAIELLEAGKKKKQA